MQTLLVDDVGRGVPWANLVLANYARQLEGDYIWVLDDDNECTLPTFVEGLQDIVQECKPAVIMVRAIVGRFGVLPPDELWGKPPVYCRIDMGCFVVSRQTYRSFCSYFHGALGADFSFISTVLDELDPARVVWWDVVAMRTQRVSAGAPE